ncbi:LysE family translocator [Pandoraea norimbergensis]|uniref:Lysine transporter LysE n=1 Tax=Pandoraea norimbergensis TaxID=93219 RepID=A0ABM5WK29_9BURK|nr:LysE family translocator [Pandoraea norimbergensis]ALS60786.1 lysine transporter LysE [Pandoraea norimbergensis]
MADVTFLSANLLVAYTAYFVGTASPGPSNLAIMSIAANHGRKPALTFALGVISGSMFWATVAMLGVSAALIAYSQFLVALKIFGGVYLLWLAFKSGRAALNPSSHKTAVSTEGEPLKRIYLRGALLHLTNPKAVLSWVSIVALSSSHDGAVQPAILPGCITISVTVFCGYALLFSTQTARRIYLRLRRWLDGGLAVVFGVVGWRLLQTARA